MDDADAATASGAGVLLTDEAREVKLENGLLFAKILRYYDVSGPRRALPIIRWRRLLRVACAAPRISSTGEPYD